MSEQPLSRQQRVIIFTGLALAVIILALTFVWTNRGPAPPVTGAAEAATTVAPTATTDLAVYFERAATAYAAGDLEAARQDYDYILQMEPGNPRAHLYRGNVLDDLGQTAQALADYDQAVQLDPTLVDAFLNRGRLHMTQTDYQAALNDYERAADLEPENARAYYGQAFAYQEMGDCDGARRYFSLTLDNDPFYTDAYYGRGRVYFHCFEDYPRAIQDFDRALEQRPEFAVVYFARALAHQLDGDETAALADFEQYLALGDDPRLLAQAEAVVTALSEAIDP